MAPNEPPMIRSGASTPPEVPEPSAIAQMSAFTAMRRATASPASCPASNALIVS